MPRSLTRPITGTPVWYYADNPPTAVPTAGIVVGLTGTRNVVNLIIFLATGNAAPALSVPYHHLTRPTGAGAWCTMPRVNEHAAGKYPSNDASNPLGVGGVAT